MDMIPPQHNTSSGESLRQYLQSMLYEAEKKNSTGIKAATLRLIMCAIRDRDILARAGDRCNGCSDTEIRTILRTMAHQREISAKEYEEAGKYYLAERDREELYIITDLCPQIMEQKELEQAISEVIKSLNATGLKDVRRCMIELKARYADRIDMAKAGKLMKTLLM